MAAATEPATDATTAEQYAEAKARYVGLQLNENELTDKIAELCAAMSSASKGQSSGLRGKALALLSGRPAPQETKTASYQEEYQKAVNERRVAREAIKLQRTIVDKLHLQKSKEIATAALPDHKLLVAEVVRCLVALCKATQAEYEFCENLFLNDVNYKSVLRAMPVRGGMHLRHHQTRAALFLREAIDYEFTTVKELKKLGVPENLLAQITAVPRSDRWC